MHKAQNHGGDIEVIVAGAGPAGMMAAIAAARRGRRVAICEQLRQPGAKLLVTGGGRCNLTNTLAPTDFMDRFGRQGRFMHPALSLLDASGLRRFMKERGVPTVAPDGFHVYPSSFSAANVQDTLWRHCSELRVRRWLGRRVTGLVIEGGLLQGVDTSAGRVRAHALVLATGGKSYPKLGATGEGYALAREAGHVIVAPLPVLVPLVTRETWPRTCAGAVVRGARAWIDVRGSRADEIGDVLFTHTGLSGPAILDLSREVVPLLQQRGEVLVRLDLKLGTSARQWQDRFEAWQTRHGRKKIVSLLDKDLPVSLARVLVGVAGLPAELTAAELARDQRQALAQCLTALPLTVVGTGGFDEAMVTRGGVNLREVDPNTLQSRLVKGLYFAGEILDLDGPCGGFNLQWAFSSGHLAGQSCAP